MNKRSITIIIAIIGTTTLFAQQPKDTINTEVVNVVKPYTPTISDAFKINDNPEVNNQNVEKEPIDYQISSVPVASTFTPSKGKAKAVTRPKKERLFDNYISFGFGNYTTPLFEAYLRIFPDKYSEFGTLMKHHSSQGGIKDLYYSDSFYDTNLDVYYKQETRDMDWKLNFGLDHTINNWYALPDVFSENTAFLEPYDSKKRLLNLGMGGEIAYYDSFFKEAKAKISMLSDNYKSSEFRIQAAPVLEFPISYETIKFEFDIDYLKGAIDRNYLNDSSISYAFFNLGLIPNFEVLRDDFRLNLSAKLYASAGSGDGILLRAYPNVNMSYQLIEEVLTIFVGATGGLHQNSYAQFSKENPFLSPNFESKQTDEKYRAYGGVKGKLASNVNYLFKGSYTDERDKPLHLLNMIKTDGVNEALLPVDVYELGNSFGIVYDDVKTLSFHGELAIDFSKEFTFGGNVDYSIYRLTDQLEAWNLPNLKATLFSDYHQGKWTGTAKLFMVGSRNDLDIPYLSDGLLEYEEYIVTDEVYLDLNLGLSYAFTNRLSAFAKGHNLLGTNYNRFYNYPGQGIQVLAGITYKFDL